MNSDVTETEVEGMLDRRQASIFTINMLRKLHPELEVRDAIKVTDFAFSAFDSIGDVLGANVEEFGNQLMAMLLGSFLQYQTTNYDDVTDEQIEQLLSSDPETVAEPEA